MNETGTRTLAATSRDAMRVFVRHGLREEHHPLAKRHCFACRWRPCHPPSTATRSLFFMSPNTFADLGRRLGAGSLLHGVVGELEGACRSSVISSALLGYRRQRGSCSACCCMAFALDGHFTRNGVDIDWGNR